MSIKSRLGRILPDKLFIYVQFYRRMGRILRLSNPQTFNAKLQWLKLYNRRPEYTMMVDKYKVRKYIAQTIGEEYLIPLLGVWDNPDEIDFETLPSQFVLKCNHNSGVGLYICKDKSIMDIDKVKKDLWKGLKQNYYLTGREWPYKNVPRKIIAEQYIVDESGTELKDYKVNCFGGVPMFVQVMSGRSKGEFRCDHFNLAWQAMDIALRIHQPSKQLIGKPKNFDEMIEVARLLGAGIPYIRVDLYQTEDRIFFGELTLYPVSGFDEDFDYQTDLKFGEMIQGL